MGDLKLRIEPGQKLRTTTEFPVSGAKMRALRAECAGGGIRVVARLEGSGDDFVDITKEGGYDLGSYEPGKVVKFEVEIESESALSEAREFSMFLGQVGSGPAGWLE